METNYYFKDPHLMKNGNDYAKYVPIGVCRYIQDEYGISFNIGRSPDLTDIPVSEGNTSPVQGADDNGDPPRDDGRKYYKCDVNHLLPNYQQLQQENCSVQVGGVRGSHGHGRGNVHRGGVQNGASSNRNHDSIDGNHKPMAVSKYIHPVDENTVVGISGTNRKFRNKCVYYVTAPWVL